MTRKIRPGEEQDVYTKFRKYLIWASRPGKVKKVKRRTHKRERQEAKREIVSAQKYEFQPLRSTNVYLEHTDDWIHCHEELTCRGDFCTLHNRSDHKMRSFPQHWRSDRAIMERICEHGVGHPDPDEFRIRNGEDDGSHGCDLCC